MSTEMSPESERYLQQAVARGTYHDRSEAIEQAVQLLRKRDQLRADVQLGIEQADRGELLDADLIFQRLEERARQIEASARANG